jgi:CBS domain-containing protein
MPAPSLGERGRREVSEVLDARRRNLMAGKTARDIMTAGADCARVDDSLADAARKLHDLDVGARPICGSDDRLAGMLTDRDIRASPRVATRERPGWVTLRTANP